MKYILLVLMLTSTSSAFSQSTANFSGIWLTSSGNYISIHQVGNAIIAATLGVQPSTGGVWEAMEGTVLGQSATAHTIYGYVNSTTTVTLTSPTTFTATQLSCTPMVAGFYCAYANGTKLTAEKIF